MDIETRLRRFEQQLEAFEKLHTDELKKFEAKLTTYLRLQADEVKFLREELAALKEELAGREVPEPAPAPIPEEQQNQPTLSPAADSPTLLSRREFLSGAGNSAQS